MAKKGRIDCPVAELYLRDGYFRCMCAELHRSGVITPDGMHRLDALCKLVLLSRERPGMSNHWYFVEFTLRYPHYHLSEVSIEKMYLRARRIPQMFFLVNS